MKKNILILTILCAIGIIVLYQYYMGSFRPENDVENAIQDALSEFSDNNLTPTESQKIMRTSQKVWVTSALFGYYRKNGKYPNDLHELIPDYYVTSIPIDAGGNPYIYTVLENHLGYSLCGVEEEGKEVCIEEDKSVDLRLSLIHI